MKVLVRVAFRCAEDRLSVDPGRWAGLIGRQIEIIQITIVEGADCRRDLVPSRIDDDPVGLCCACPLADR